MSKSRKFPHITRLLPAVASLVFKTTLTTLFLAIIVGGVYLRLNGAKLENPNILGTKAEPVIEMKNQAEIEEYEKKLSYWLSIIREKPNYRDAFIQAAFYLEKLERWDEASQMRKKANSLDVMLDK